MSGEPLDLMTDGAGARFNQSTPSPRMGRQVIAGMNRVGLVVDMSHSAERSTLEAIEISERPIAISHANPHFWHAARRNKSDEVLRALIPTCDDKDS